MTMTTIQNIRSVFVVTFRCVLFTRAGDGLVSVTDERDVAMVTMTTTMFTTTGTLTRAMMMMAMHVVISTMADMTARTTARTTNDYTVTLMRILC